MSILDEQALERYATVRLTADLSGLTVNERAMIPILIRAAEHMNAIYWLEVVGPHHRTLDGISDPALRRRVEVNFGPWDRMDADSPLVPGAGERPKGASFYPSDMTVDEFDAAADGVDGEALRSQYTVLRRGGDRRLEAIPYRVAFEDDVLAAATWLREAATLAEDAGLRRYLELRATALETDEYRASDEAWMDMKTNTRRHRRRPDRGI